MSTLVEFPGVRMLAREFGKVPVELRRELRPKLRKAGEIVRDDIKAEAGRFSTSIPPAVRMSVSFASKTGGLRIYVDKKRAPGARALENLGAEGTFRHPVFGDREVWVAQPAHPFFFRAVKRNRAKVRSLVEDAVRASLPRGTLI